MLKKIIMLFLAASTGAALSSGASAATSLEVKNPGAPAALIALIEIKASDIDAFVSDWNERAELLGQLPGYISATLYRSVLPDHKYQLVSVVQFQSYTDGAAADSDPEYAASLSKALARTESTQRENGFYRPVASHLHTYTGALTAAPPKNAGGESRVVKNPAFINPEAPFVFINIFEIADNDIATFVSDWKRRSKITSRQPGSISATVYKALSPDQKYQLMNVSQWQSYNAYVEGQNGPEYTQQLEADLAETRSLVITRGFFRPIASHMRYYPELPPETTPE